MSWIIRLSRLPWSASAGDIRGFFEGLGIPEGGVHIVGGRDGDAFIAFASDDDARQAMARSGRPIQDTPVSLRLSSRAEMAAVVQAAKGQLSSSATAPTAPTSALSPNLPLPKAPQPSAPSAKAQLSPWPSDSDQGGWPPKKEAEKPSWASEGKADWLAEPSKASWAAEAAKDVWAGPEAAQKPSWAGAEEPRRDPRSRPAAPPSLGPMNPLNSSPKSKARLAAEILETAAEDEEYDPSQPSRSGDGQASGQTEPSWPPPQASVFDRNPARRPDPPGHVLREPLQGYAPTSSHSAAPPSQTTPSRPPQISQPPAQPPTQPLNPDHLSRQRHQPLPTPQAFPFNAPPPNLSQPPPSLDQDSRPWGQRDQTPWDTAKLQAQPQAKLGIGYAGNPPQLPPQAHQIPQAPPHPMPDLSQPPPVPAVERRSGKSLLPLPPPPGPAGQSTGREERWGAGPEPAPKRQRSVLPTPSSSLGDMWSAGGHGSWDRPAHQRAAPRDESWKPQPSATAPAHSQPLLDLRPPSLMNIGPMRLSRPGAGGRPSGGGIRGPFPGPPPRQGFPQGPRPPLFPGRGGPGLPPQEVVMAMRDASPAVGAPSPASSRAKTRYAIVSRLPSDLSTKVALMEFFAPIELGSLENVKMVCGPDGASLGMAYVRFPTTDDTTSALGKDGKFGIRIRPTEAEDFRKAVDGPPGGAKRGPSVASRFVCVRGVPLGAAQGEVEALFGRQRRPKRLLRASEPAPGGGVHWFAEMDTLDAAAEALGLRGRVRGSDIRLRESTEGEMGDYCEATSQPAAEPAPLQSEVVSSVGLAGTVLRLSGLPPDVGLEEVVEFVGSGGATVVEDSVRVRASGSEEGYEAVLAVLDSANASAAVAKLNGQTLRGRPIALSLPA